MTLLRRRRKGLDPIIFPIFSGRQETFMDLIFGFPGLLAYWPLIETAGIVVDNALGNAAFDLTYINNPSLATTVFPASTALPLFDKANDAVDLYNSAFPAAFDGDNGYVHMWIKHPYPAVSVGYPVYAYVSSTYRIYNDRTYMVMRSSGNIYFGYDANDAYWHQVVLGWGGGSGYGWFDGVPVTLWSNTKGAWVGALSNTLTAIAAQSIAGIASYNGSVGHVAWGAGNGNLPTDAQIAAVYDKVYPTRNEIIFCGDSKTDEDIWPMLTKSALSVATSSLWRIADDSYAVTGYTVAQLHARIDSHTPNQGINPSIACINIGVNDATGAPVEAAWKADLIGCIDGLRTRWPTIQLHRVPVDDLRSCNGLDPHG